MAVIEPNKAPYSIMDKLLNMTELSKKYGVPVFTSVAGFMASGVECDGVVICSSHATHAEIAMAFLKADKHVLIEKPMTISVEESEVSISKVMG